MNVTYIPLKTSIVFLLILCFVISFNTAEAGRSVRVRKLKTHIAPRHISISARSGNGMYARTYAYGRPIPSYSTAGKNGRYHTKRRRSGRRDNYSKTYASRYRNWSHDPRADRIGQLKKRKELLPFLTEPPFGGNKHKRRIRPHRLSAMQRPQPPKKPNEFHEDYFFPEEAKRAETKYEFESRYPRPKKRRPEFESSYKFENSKIPYYDEKPLEHETKQRPAFSYSSFVQHTPEDSEDLYEDTDSVFSQPVIRNKKKRVKKKSNSRKKLKERYKPFRFENDQTSAVDNYPPYITSDEYELPSKSYKKRNKPNYDNEEEDFLPSQTYKPRPQVSTLFSTDSDYKSSQKTHQLQFNPTYSQTWSQSAVETTARPVTHPTDSGFQPQYIPSQYNYNKDYTTLQKTKTVTTNTQSTYYSQPDNSYKTPYNNFASNQISAQSNTQNYNKYSGHYNQPSSTYSQPSPSYSQPSPTYSQPLPSSSSVFSDVTIQKSVPVYDNTETFYNFNNNAFVNSQSSKYYNSDNNSSKYYEPDTSQQYGTRVSSTSYRNKLGEKTDSDTEFIKKHQNLYNNGLTGVPVQGDGYAKESTKKDYDIGYGDFQFDENPTS